MLIHISVKERKPEFVDPPNENHPPSNNQLNKFWDQTTTILTWEQAQTKILRWEQPQKKILKTVKNKDAQAGNSTHRVSAKKLKLSIG